MQLSSRCGDKVTKSRHVTVVGGEEKQLHTNAILDTLLSKLLVGGAGWTEHGLGEGERGRMGEGKRREKNVRERERERESYHHPF